MKNVFIVSIIVLLFGIMQMAIFQQETPTLFDTVTLFFVLSMAFESYIKH